MEKKHKPIIGISLGDYNGIGPEVIIKSILDPRLLRICTPIIYGSARIIHQYRKSLKIKDLFLNYIKTPDEANPRKLNMVNCWSEDYIINPGKVEEQAGKCAFIALEQATKDLSDGVIDGLVTAPINKNNIQSEDFKFPGHTEYLANYFDVKDNLMFMVSEGIKIGVVTGHIPIKDVSAALTADKIKLKIDLMLKSLKKDFAINKPRIAVLGLNPHAGEGGLLGEEDDAVIAPVIEEFKKKGELVFGPFPSDGFFGSAMQKKFDGVLAMYHDQGLAPFKALTFGQGVNFTAGMPVVRTSPDHGTAYNIAGKGEADHLSMMEAIYMAVDVLKHRRETYVPMNTTRTKEDRQIRGRRK